MGAFHNSIKDEGSFLLFESKLGQGTLLSAAKIQGLIKRILPTLELVFVAACHSLVVGKIFQKCGAKHVICVEQDKEVLDDGVLYFTKRFYQLLLEQETICEAFNQAVASVKFKYEQKEGEMFVLLTQEMLQQDLEQIILSSNKLGGKVIPHVCNSRIKVQEGKLECISDHILVK